MCMPCFPSSFWKYHRFLSVHRDRKNIMSCLILPAVVAFKRQEMGSLESFLSHRWLGLSQFLIPLFWLRPETCTSNKFLSFLLLKKFRKWCFSLRYFWDLTASDSALLDLLCFCQSDLILRCPAGDSAPVNLLCFCF